MMKDETSTMINEVINKSVEVIAGYDASTVEEVILKNQISMIFQRHIPKKPLRRVDSDKNIRFCPRCYEEVEHKAYCSNCGQAIEWGEEE